MSKRSTEDLDAFKAMVEVEETKPVSKQAEFNLIRKVLGGEDCEEKVLNLMRWCKGDMYLLFNSPAEELAKVLPTGDAEALAAAFELGTRPKMRTGNLLRPTFDDMVKRYEDRIGSKNKEQFIVSLFDKRGEMFYEEILFEGGKDYSPVDVSAIVRLAIVKEAASVLVGHNHPNANAMPSPEDLVITNALIKALWVLGIKLQDHIIIGREDYFSLACLMDKTYWDSNVFFDPDAKWEFTSKGIFPEFLNMKDVEEFLDAGDETAEE